MNTAYDFDVFFSSWANAGSLVDGFVDWAWESRGETLAQLDGHELAGDLAYALRQGPEWQERLGFDEDQAKTAAARWLDENREALKEALGASIDD